MSIRIKTRTGPGISRSPFSQRLTVRVSDSITAASAACVSCSASRISRNSSGCTARRLASFAGRFEGGNRDGQITARNQNGAHVERDFGVRMFTVRHHAMPCSVVAQHAHNSRQFGVCRRVVAQGGEGAVSGQNNVARVRHFGFSDVGANPRAHNKGPLALCSQGEFA